MKGGMEEQGSIGDGKGIRYAGLLESRRRGVSGIMGKKANNP